MSTRSVNRAILSSISLDCWEISPNWTFSWHGSRGLALDSEVMASNLAFLSIKVGESRSWNIRNVNSLVCMHLLETGVRDRYAFV